MMKRRGGRESGGEQVAGTGPVRSNTAAANPAAPNELRLRAILSSPSAEEYIRTLEADRNAWEQTANENGIALAKAEAELTKALHDRDAWNNIANSEAYDGAEWQARAEKAEAELVDTQRLYLEEQARVAELEAALLAAHEEEGVCSCPGDRCALDRARVRLKPHDKEHCSHPDCQEEWTREKETHNHATATVQPGCLACEKEEGA